MSKQSFATSMSNQSILPDFQSGNIDCLSPMYMPWVYWKNTWFDNTNESQMYFL